jgi:MFS transporter, SP family, galactose:H+ symporter
MRKRPTLEYADTDPNDRIIPPTEDCIISSSATSTTAPRSIIQTVDSSNIQIPGMVIKATIIASLGGLLFGYDMGVISGALPLMTPSLNLSERQQEWVVGILYVGGGLGAGIGGYLCDAMGRKATILLTDVLFVVGAIILFLSRDINQIWIGRFIVGMGISISGIADVSYLHEIAPISWRGSIVSVNEACISLGFLLAFGSAVWLQNVTDGWRHMFGIAGYLAVIQFLGMIFMPESPVWLQQQGKLEDRDEVLHMIYGKVTTDSTIIEDIDDDTKCMEDTTFQFKQFDGIVSSPFVSREATYDALVSPREKVPISSQVYSNYATRVQSVLYIFSRYRAQISISLFLSIAQQLSGQVAILNYAPLIFSRLNHSDLSTTLWIGVVKFLVTVVVIWRVERYGRRSLLLLGMIMIISGQCLLAFAFSLVDNEQNLSQSAISWALIGVILVVSGYSCSFGPLTWLLTSELFPTNIRGRALGASTITTYFSAALVTSTFLSLQTVIGNSAVFLLFGVVTLIGLIFVFVAIPDTGGKSPKEIDTEIRSMNFWGNAESHVSIT